MHRANSDQRGIPVAWRTIQLGCTLSYTHCRRRSVHKPSLLAWGVGVPKAILGWHDIRSIDACLIDTVVRQKLTSHEMTVTMGPSLIDTEVELKRRMPSGAMHYGVAVDGSEMSKRAMAAGLYLNNTKVLLVPQLVVI